MDRQHTQPNSLRAMQRATKAAARGQFAGNSRAVRRANAQYKAAARRYQQQEGA